MRMRACQYSASASASWTDMEVLPQLRSAEKQPITPAARGHAAEQVNQATTFLNWLADRNHTLTAANHACR
ncbi:hypothetical protein AB0I10_33910 [Streptomyces sp. NPDC050636]|uniref:hypothetical protein n=1 Tax=Streptomyces sp. NPDC050636 TaxID=3154510 RepID=UPI003413D10E